MKQMCAWKPKQMCAWKPKQMWAIGIYLQRLRIIFKKSTNVARVSRYGAGYHTNILNPSGFHKTDHRWFMTTEKQEPNDQSPTLQQEHVSARP